MTATIPTPPTQATDRGHMPEWDPPRVRSRVRRWTCPCGATVWDDRGRVYGSATETDCPQAVPA